MLVNIFGGQLEAPTNPPPNTARPDPAAAGRHHDDHDDLGDDHDDERTPTRPPTTTTTTNPTLAVPNLRPGALHTRSSTSSSSLVEALSEGVPGERGALDPHRELHDAG